MLDTTTTVATTDPVFTARARWKKAEAAYLDASEAAEREGGSQRVAIPTATGGERYAATPDLIDRAIDEERRRKVWHCAEWVSEPPASYDSFTDAERAAARAWTPPDADALKAQLAAAKARYAEAMARHRVEALSAADFETGNDYLATPATTPAGIAQKLRDSGYTTEPEIAAALADLDRMAGEGAQMGAPLDPACTPVAYLHADYRAACDAAHAAQDDAAAQPHIDRANDIEAAMVSASLLCPEDVARVVQTVAREWYRGEGDRHRALSDRLDQIAGEGAA